MSVVYIYISYMNRFRISPFIVNISKVNQW